MERWRWLPEQLGKFYVWDNVPEALTRIIKDGKIIHTARIIVGQPTWPTPSFSADMKTIVFHPTWGVPEGIKAKELAPILRKSSGGGLFGIFGGGYSANAVLEAYQLHAYINGRQIDGNSVDWSSVDMRSVSFQQPPGPKNPLGEVKFLFPNKHDVYMHDTPERNLFPKTFRAFSHGCMRVQDPSLFAEIILAEDKGWPAEKTRSMFGAGSQDVPLDTHIPVHVTYMTARVTEDGKLETYGDVYGLDGRVAAALGNKNVRFEQPVIPQQDVASDDDPLASAPGQRGKQGRKRQTQGAQTLGDAISGIFSP
jgi:L,D-transpeptidase YcbB